MRKLLIVMCLAALFLPSIAPARAVSVAPGPAWRWPLLGTPRVVNAFDPPAKPWLPGHRGVDLGAEPEAVVLAAGAGQVRFAGVVVSRPVISISHPNGLITTYEPVAALVKAGDQVAAGQLIGTLLSGHAGCPAACLHWGLRLGDAYLDPLALLGLARIRLLPSMRLAPRRRADIRNAADVRFAGMTEQITAGQFHAADDVEDWRSLYHVVAAHFQTGSLANGIALVDEIGRIATGAQEQYLNIDLRSAGVTVSLGRRDIALARQISAAAKELDIPADPTAVQLINVTLDALVGADVLPFWRALLGYRQISDDYLFDPASRGPGFGLQQLDATRPQRNRMHLDIAVPHDQAEARIAAALAAGGHLVSDAHAPKWWVLADAEGNEACVATWVGRE